MKSNYKEISNEHQSSDKDNSNIEYDRLFRLYLKEYREKGSPGIITYQESHILKNANIITEDWLKNEIRIQKKQGTILSSSLSYCLEDMLVEFKSWMKGRRKEKIAHFLS